jgi:hypothetical protein
MKDSRRSNTNKSSFGRWVQRELMLLPLLLLLLLQPASALTICRRTFCTSAIAASALATLNVSAAESDSEPRAALAHSALATLDVSAAAAEPPSEPRAPVAHLEKPLSALGEAISGFASGAVVSTTKQLLLHPLDTVKVRSAQGCPMQALPSILGSRILSVSQLLFC